MVSCWCDMPNNTTVWFVYLMTIPLSIEKLSVGKPAMFQERIRTWSPRVEMRENSFEHGIPRFLTASIHWAICSWKQTKSLITDIVVAPYCSYIILLCSSNMILTLKVLNFWNFTSYCSLKPLWSGMGEVVPARTSPTPLCINCRD